MSSSHDFLSNLALVLCVAALTTVVSRRLRLPGVFGYLVAGMVVGPATPIPVLADADQVRTLAELGVILLMYALGLEFRLGQVLRIAATSGIAALAETSLMFGLGYLAATLLGWTPAEAAVTGAMVAISSTTIIARVFNEAGVTGVVRTTVFGLLIVEDLIAILLIAVISAAGSSELTGGRLFVTGIRLATFLIAFIAIGRLAIPRFILFARSLANTETLVVTAVALSFAGAWVALSVGYSVALGAFITGSLVAESGLGEHIAEQTTSIRDVFVAIFFVAVGMMIDPAAIMAEWKAVLLLTLVVVGGKVIAVSLGAFLTGQRLRDAVQSGMSMAQIGEFSFIIAGVGIASGSRDLLLPVAISVSALTTLLTPWLVRHSAGAAAEVDRRLPPALQTLVSLYGSWFSGLTRNSTATGDPILRRAVWWVVVDVTLLMGLIVAASAEMGRLAVAVETWFGWTRPAGRWVVVALSFVAALPFLAGLLRLTRVIASRLAQRSMPTPSPGRLDRAFAPRTAFVRMLHYGLLVCCALPLFAVLVPLAPNAPVLLLAGTLAVVGVVAVWRSATSLYGHARAGAEVIVMALMQHDNVRGPQAQLEAAMTRVTAMLPGLGDPEPLRLREGDPAVGQTLASLDLRGATGANVVAILRVRGEELESVTPMADEPLLVGDVLAIAGAPEALAAARALLLAPG